MGNSKHRKNHKEKLAQRKTKIAQGKNSYKKYMDQQIKMIQEQMKNNANSNVATVSDADFNGPTTEEKISPNFPANIMLAAELNRLEEANDKIK